jgi:hypothetical protein
MLDRRQALGALTLGGAGLASGTDAAITSPFANGRLLGRAGGDGRARSGRVHPAPGAGGSAPIN